MPQCAEAETLSAEGSQHKRIQKTTVKMKFNRKMRLNEIFYYQMVTRTWCLLFSVVFIIIDPVAMMVAVRQYSVCDIILNYLS